MGKDKDKDKDKDEEDDEDETGKKKKSSSRGNSDDEEEGKGKKKGSTNNSRSGTPTKDVERIDKAEKRKAMVANLLDPNAEAPAKKSRLEQFGAAAPAAMQGSEKVPEEEANDHNRLAQEVPVQEDWNPECPTGPTSCKYPEEDQPAQAQGQGSHLPVPQRGKVNKRTCGHRQQ